MQRQEITGNKVRGDLNVSQTYIENNVSADEGQRAVRSEVALALLQGPADAIGMSAELEQAEELREAQPARAATLFIEVARALDASGKHTPAEVMLERAAVALTDADGDAAFGLYVEVAKRELARGAAGAETTARRARAVAPVGREWVADGLLAQAMWPEHEDHVVPVIAHAWEQSRGSDAEVEWAAALVEILSLLGRLEEALEVASGYAQTPLGLGFRLQLELDRLEAAGESGAETDKEWQRLLTWVQGRDDAAIALVHQRRGIFLSRRGQPEAAVDCFRLAVQHWGRVDGGEGQMAEAHFAESLAWEVAGRYAFTTDGRRAIAAELQGDPSRPAAIADRLVSEGIRPLLNGKKLFNAKRSLMLAHAFHRRAGNLRGVFDTHDLLARLFRQAGEGSKALGHLIRIGAVDGVAEIGKAAEGWEWEFISSALQLDGSGWERATSYAALAEVGGAMPEDEAQAAAPGILEAASEFRGFGPGPHLGKQARRALAAIVCSLSDDQLARALPLLREEILQNGWADKEAVRALSVLTKTGRSDETSFLLDASLKPDANAVRNASGLVIERLRTDPALRGSARAAAEAGNREALNLLAYAGLEDEEVSLRALCDERVQSYLDRPIEPEPPGQRSASIVSLESLGQVGACADPELAQRLFRTLVGFATDRNELEPSRASAVRAATNLSESVDPDLANEGFAALLPLAFGSYESAWTDDGIITNNPMSRFQISLGPPMELRAAAVGAICALCERASATPPVLLDALQAALRSDDPLLVGAALDGMRVLSSLEVGLEFSSYLRHPEPQVRVSALRLLVSRDAGFIATADGLEAARDASRYVRSVALALAREAAEGHTLIAELRDDPDSFIRLAAQQTD